MRNNLLILTTLACLLFAGCRKQEEGHPPVPGKGKADQDQSKDGAESSDEGSSEVVSYSSSCDDVTTDLMAGQHHNAGDVIVNNDDENLYVTFSTSGGWVLNHTHLYAGPIEDLPANNGGNPKIGNFPYQEGHNPNVESYTYAIPLSELADEECIAIATHAEVKMPGSTGEKSRSETGWGAGTEITEGGSWATWFEYCYCSSEDEEDDSDDSDGSDNDDNEEGSGSGDDTGDGYPPIMN